MTATAHDPATQARPAVEGAMDGVTRSRTARRVTQAHGAYLVVSGIWPLLHRGSFERVTGRKTDFWLVRLVGGLALVCGLVLSRSARAGEPSPDARLLAGGQAAAFAAADLYAAKSFSRWYLGDFVVQLLATPAWFVGRRHHR